MFEIPAGARHLQIEEVEPASHSIGECALVPLSLHPLPLSQPYSASSHPEGRLWVVAALRRQGPKEVLLKCLLSVVTSSC